MYGFGSDGRVNIEFDDYLIDVLSRVSRKWHRWGRDKCRWSELESFEKKTPGSRGSSESGAQADA